MPDEWKVYRLPSRCLDALEALTHWLEGFEASGKPKIVGRHELMMLLRSMQEVEPNTELVEQMVTALAAPAVDSIMHGLLTAMIEATDNGNFSIDQAKLFLIHVINTAPHSRIQQRGKEMKKV